MPAVTQVPVRFQDKQGKPLAFEGARLYQWTEKAVGPAFAKFTTPACEYKLDAKGNIQALWGGKLYKAASSTMVTVETKVSGPMRHLFFFTKEESGLAYLAKYWDSVQLWGVSLDKKGGPEVIVGKGMYTVKIAPDTFVLNPKGKCEAVKVAVAGDDGKFEDRQPGADKVIGLVGTPLKQRKIGFNNKSFDDAGDMKDLLKDYANSKHGFSTWAKNKDRKNRQEAAEKAGQSGAKPPADTELGFSMFTMQAYGGFPTKQLVVHCSTKCKAAHAVTVTGGKLPVTTLAKGKTVKLRFDGNDDPFGKGYVVHKPTRYTAKGKGCTGETFSTLVDVYPSTQVGLTMEWTLAFWKTKCFGKMGKWLEKFDGSKGDTGKKPNSKGLTFEAKGTASFLCGYVEEPYSPNVAFQHLYAGEIGVGAGLNFTFSMLQLAFGIPQSISDYVGDLRFTIGIDGKFSVGGELATKRLGHPDGKQLASVGKVVAKIGFGIPLSLEGYIGKKGLLGASASAATRVGLWGQGEGSRNKEGQLAIVLSYGYDESKIEIELTLDVIIWSKKKTFDPVKLWDKGTLGETAPLLIGEAKK